MHDFLVVLGREVLSKELNGISVQADGCVHCLSDVCLER